MKRCLERADLGILSITLEGGRGDHQLAHHIWVADRGLQGDAAARRKAEDIGAFKSHMLDQGSDVVRHLLVGQRAIDVGGVPMALGLDGDDLPRLGQRRQQLVPSCQSSSSRRE